MSEKQNDNAAEKGNPAGNSKAPFLTKNEPGRIGYAPGDPNGQGPSEGNPDEQPLGYTPSQKKS